jgi:predicted RNA-binding Zn-ribbon protein involved in translation (DUF1610 family)
MAEAAACRMCGASTSVKVGVVRMGQVDLFACPRCYHQEVWRGAGVQPAGARTEPLGSDPRSSLLSHAR